MKLNPSRKKFEGGFLVTDEVVGEMKCFDDTSLGRSEFSM